jgi:hypothetical protein
VRSRPLDLQDLRGTGPRALVPKRRAHVRDVDSAAPKLVIDAGMFVHAGAAVMHDEGNALRRIPKRMAFGPEVTDARTGLAHDRDLAPQLPVLKASLHPDAVREEPHLVVGGREAETFPE